jgi:hypothetical protein
VGADGLIKSAAANEPRFDHNPTTGESLGLLVEEARTNLVQRSQEFDNGYWSPVATTTTPNAAVAPDGTMTADKVTPNNGVSSNNFCTTRSFTGLSGSTTGSFYVKSAGHRYVRISGYVLDLLSTQNGQYSVYVGNGWHRIYNEYTTSNVDFNLNITSATAGQTFTGNGVDGVYQWGAQLEAGSFPTSYIPTTGSTVTRSADVASITGTNFSRWHNSQGIGTIASLAKGIKTAKLGAIYSILSTDNSFSNMIEVEYDSRSPQLRIYKNSAGIIDAGTINNDTFAKTCMSYSPGSYAAVLNGSIIATSNSAGDFPTPLSLLYLGRGYNEDGGRLNGTIARLTYYPTRLQDSQLQQLTK